MKEHRYQTRLVWTGNRGEGTSNYRSYDRNHEIQIEGKAQTLMLSSDPSFLGDASRHNPEELLVASLSSCHMLWYLHLCATNGIKVVDYTDSALGKMIENPDGSGEFSEVTLFPEVEILDETNSEKALELHTEANQKCFIARSCNFPVKHQPKIKIKGK